MGKIYATTSGKGGVGKSTTAVGLGFAFAHLGERVLLVDMDEGLRCLDLLLGVDNSVVLDLADVLDGTPIEDAAYICQNDKLHLITAPMHTGAIDRESFARFAKTASIVYDVVIFDFPAGLDFSLYTALPKSTLFLTVATPDPVSVRDAAAVSERLHSNGLGSRLIINRFAFKDALRHKQKNIDGIINTATLRLLGIVPDSRELTSLSLTHKIKKNCRAMKAFLRIAGRLMDKNIPLKKLKKI